MKKIVLSSVIALCVAMPAVASAQDIDNTNGTTPSGGAYAPFGSPDTSTYGVVFSGNAGDNVLNSFTMFLTQGSGVGALNFRGYVGAWDGSKASSILYTSPTVTKSVNGAEAFLFNTGALAITSGAQYVAFLSTSDLGSQGDRTFVMPRGNGVSDPRLSFAYYNNGTNFAALTTNSWNASGLSQVAFRADFSAGGGAGAVPEPATWGMLLAGFGAMGLAMRRRAKLRTNVSFG